MEKAQRLDPRAKSTYDVETAALLRRAAKTGGYKPSRASRRHSFTLGDHSRPHVAERGRLTRRRSLRHDKTEYGLAAQLAADSAREEYYTLLRVNVRDRLARAPEKRDETRTRARSAPADDREPELLEEQATRRKSMHGKEKPGAYKDLWLELGLPSDFSVLRAAITVDDHVEGVPYVEFLRPFATAGAVDKVERNEWRAPEKSKKDILRSVDLTRKGFTQVPLEAWLLLSPAVHTLKFSRNRLMGMPDVLGRWADLQVLKLDYNQLKRLPKTIGKYCQNLREFNLSNNLLADLPASFRMLTSLENLGLAGNQFKSVPHPVSFCTQIQKLTLRDNVLSTATALGALRLLSSLSLSKNAPLIHLPLELGACTGLTELQFDNHVEFPPEEIWSISREHLLQHLAHLLASRDTNSVNLSNLKIRSLGEPLCREANLTSLDMSCNEVHMIPAAISMLKNLSTLLLNDNKIAALPDEFGGLSALTHLSMERNSLAILPATLGKLRLLKVLKLSYNKLVALPLSLRFLGYLHELTLAGNALDQPPADVAGAGASCVVQYMGALSSFLSGRPVNMSRAGLQYFPLVLLQPPSQDMAHVLGLGEAEGFDTISPPPIETIMLDGNYLRAIPGEHRAAYITGPVLGNSLRVLNLGLASLSSITSISVSGNRMTSIPASIACLTALTRLKADNNLISDWVEAPGSSRVENMRRLAVVSLADNQLVFLPEAVSKLSALTTLCLDSNFITSLPQWIRECSMLTCLSINNNHLTSLPDGMGKLTDMRELNLSGNAITHVPERLYVLTNLTRLRLSRNKIGTLSRDVARLKCLTELSICSNQLTNLPPSLASMPGLESLNVDGNDALCLQLPEDVLKRSTAELKGFLRRLYMQTKTLDLGEMNLSTVPLAILEQPNIHTLVLRRNNLTSLPRELEMLHGLKSIDISANAFEELPEILLTFSCLTHLNIDGNPLPNLPHEVLQQGSMKVLEMMRRVRGSRVSQRLDLSNLGLASLPLEVLEYDYVQDLCIDGNLIQKLPEVLCWKLPSLTRLSARSNKLTSPLPLRIWLWSSLTSLDLAQNKLVSLPVGLALLTRLRNLATASNPLNLPTSSLLSRGLPSTMSFLRSLSDVGVGMRQTQFMEPIAGVASSSELAPYARPEGSECVLVQDGKRLGVSLKDAMRLARAGATVLLRPGTYTDILCFSVDGVTVGGDAAVEDVVIKAAGGENHERGMPPCAVVCRALDCKLINVSVVYSGTVKDSSAILVQSGSMVIKNCIIHNGIGAGITVRRGMDVSIEGNRLHDCGGTGVALEQEVHAQVRYNDIVRCRGNGLQFCEGANPLVEFNRIAKGKQSGVLIAVKGRGIIRSNEILLNAKAAIEIRSESDPVVEKNKMAKNLVGIMCVEGGKGKLLDNIITDSVSAGISVISKGKPEIIGNRINGSVRATGILLLQSAHTPVSDVEMQGMEIGLVCAEGAQAKIVRSRIYHMTTSGVIVRGAGSKLECVEGEIFGNGGIGFRGEGCRQRHLNREFSSTQR